MNVIAKLPLGALLSILIPVSVIAAPPASLQNPNKQLVVDERAIDQLQNVTLVQGQIRKHPDNPLIQADQPWENALNNLYPNVIYDNDMSLFTMWYKCVLADADLIAKLDPPRTVHDVGWMLLYATSRDGVTWNKPSLGLHSFAGSTANNAVARDTPNVGVFRDTNPDCVPARRFKMIYDVGMGKMRVRFSHDGRSWNDPIEAKGLGSRVGDTHNNAFWDARLKRYVLISRVYSGERLVARSTSKDFVHWEPEQVVLRSTPEEGRKRQTYCMPSFAYGSGYFGFLMMYNVHGGRTVDCELTWSPDSIHWKRLFPGQAFIRRGEAGSYDSQCIYAQANPPVIRDGQMSIYYGGSDFRHKGWKRHCLPCLATLDQDRFAGYRNLPAANEVETSKPGTILSHPLRISAESLTISADADRGRLLVEIIDEADNVVAKSRPIESNVTDHTVQWNDDFNFASLNQQTVRVRFTLENATLFTFSGLKQVSGP